jgi:NAD(P)-dependent dehydrogenase (short-subunit alcohol dehydrogenase family)
MIGHFKRMKRGGVPDEIARAALFLASGETGYVYRDGLVFDGGLSVSHPFFRQEYGRTSL